MSEHTASSESQSPHVSFEQINIWLDTGLEKEHTLVSIGTSIERLKQIISTGELIPARIDFPYQKELLEEFDGNYLYYATPLLETLGKYKPELQADLEKRIDELDEDSEIEDYFSLEVMNDENVLYARVTAMQDYFLFQTGEFRYHTDIVSMGYFLFGPEKLLPRENILVDRDENEVNEILSRYYERYGKQRFDTIIEQALSRRGVVLYLGKDVSEARIEIGEESSEEVILITNQPLTYKAINGINVLSDSERTELQNSIK